MNFDDDGPSGFTAEDVGKYKSELPLTKVKQ